VIFGEVKSEIVVDHTSKLIKDLNELVGKEVLVGVPESKDARKLGVGNASLAYIHDKGAPLQNIPARPFMEPGIKRAQKEINRHFLSAALARFAGETVKMEDSFEKVGLSAQSGIKRVINEGLGFTPLKRATRLGRLDRRKTAKRYGSSGF